MKRFCLRAWQFLNLVHPYQSVLYLWLFLWGVYSALRREPLAMAAMMPPGVYRVWLIMHIAAPLVVWTGQLLLINPTPKRTMLSWELQWAGDASIFFIAATTAYAFSRIADPADPGAYIVVAFASWAICVFLLAIRDAIAIGYYWGTCHGPKRDTDDVD